MAPSSRALVPLDSEPLLRAERLACEKAATQLDATRARVDHFLQVSQPAYSRWLHSSFGPALTRLRELELQAHELEFLIRDVEEAQAETGRSAHRAYEDVMRRRMRGHADGPPPERELPPPGWGPADKEPGDEEKEPPPPRSGTASAANPPGPANESGVRALYRALARRLHPDLNPRLGPFEKGLWHDVQAAYEARDLERLETLAAQADSGDSGFSSVRSLARLRAIRTDLRERARLLERELRSLRRDPAWAFDKVEKDPGRLAELERVTRLGLADSLVRWDNRVRVRAERVRKWRKRTDREKTSR